MARPEFTEGVNSYVSEEYALAYFSSRGLEDDWEASSISDEARVGALIAATEFLDGKFKWRGYIQDATTQSLGWPRYSARDHEGRLLTVDYVSLVDDDGVPFAVKNACCEMALAHVTVESLTAAKERGGDVKLVKVGPITQEFFESATGGATFPHIRRMLKGTYSGHPSITFFGRK
jgi:hypothetical protein